ncbi:hypothetical protein P0D69_42505 [Paraburkholderia sediminicola]|uniref:hypothetical protein n=1 Tax=Paraburkholderia sediminicola TaxID=458836 RepID=UPI0038B94487
MNAHGRGFITISMLGLDGLKVIQAVIEERVMPSLADERLRLSRRGVDRLANGYRCEGAAGLVSRRRGHRAIISCPSSFALKLWRSFVSATPIPGRR